jgi:hypothetical protein
MGEWGGRRDRSRGLAGGVGRWVDRACEVTSKRVQWEGETQTLKGGFVTGKEDLNSIARLEQGGLRAERKESLDKWNFRSLAIAMAEIVRIRGTVFRPL